MSISGTLSTAQRALETYSAAMQVAGDNIANANTPGYIRNVLVLAGERPYQFGGVLIGAGVKPAAVRQQVDQYLEARIHAANSDATGAAARESIYKQLELELRELGDTDISTRLSDFVSTVNEVVNQPEQRSLRRNVIEQGSLLAADIRDLRGRVDQLREQQNTRISDLTSEANGLIDSIQNLNQSIASLESNGLSASQAGSLRSQRYDALNRLSEIIPITYQEERNGVVSITSGSDYVLLENRSQHLVTASLADRGTRVQTVEFDKTHTVISQSGGELKGVFEARDEILGGFIDNFDQLVGNLIFEFNRIHSSGEGLEGYSSVTAENRVSDVNVALGATTLPFKPNHGSFDLKVINQQTGIAETHNIAIDADGIGGNDSSLESIRAALDSLDHIDATISTLGELQIKSDAGYEFRFSNDTSGALAALGINTFFTGSDAVTINISSTITKNNNLFAAGQGGGPADNRNAQRLAQILDNPIPGLQNSSLSDFYDSLVSQVGQGSAKEAAAAKGLGTFRESLLSQRDQYSGVSLDEETVKLINAQQAFAASAKVIQTVDEMLQVLLQM